MAIKLNEQEEANRLKKLLAGGLGDGGVIYSNFLSKLAKEVTDEFKEAIADNVRSQSGTLAQSVTFEVDDEGFTIDADFYYAFIDEGVNHAPKVEGLKYRGDKTLVQGSPYSFKHLGVPERMANKLREFTSSIEHAYAVGVTIKKYGIKAKNITEQVMTDELLDKIGEDLSKITGITFDVMFEQNIGKQAEQSGK